MKNRLNRKHVLALALAVLLLLPSVLLCACGNNNMVGKTSSKATETQTAPEVTEQDTTEKTTEAETTPEATEKDTEKETEPETTGEVTETQESESTDEPETRSPADIAEEAMNSFLNKVEAGNYVIDFKDHLKISVCSDDMVVYELGDKYGIGFGDEIAYFEMAVMTINGNETFCVYFGENDEELVHFGGEGKALELTNAGAASQVLATRLLHYWLDENVTEGNIWNLFTNYDPEKPLSFIATDFHNVVPETMKILGGLGEGIAGRMQDIYLEFEEEDVQTAHFRTSFAPGLTPVPDIDIVITFGNAEAEKRADAWMKNEDRTLPEVKTAWDETDIMNLNSVFLPPYGENAVPFPKFATPTFFVDISHVLSEEKILFRDLRATEEDMAAYEGQLEEDGYTKAETADGSTVYRKILREAYQCYANLELEYDHGVNITAGKYYDFPRYDGLEAINKVITETGFPELSEDESFTRYDAHDRASELIESWMYLFDYKLGLYTEIRYDSREDAEKYLEAYTKVLEENGFELALSDEEYEEYEEPENYFRVGLRAGDPARLTELMGEDNYMQLKTKEGLKSFRYHFEPDGKTLDLLFKSEAYVPREEAVKRLTEAGFPEIGIPEENYVVSRDLKLFQKTMFGHDAISDLSLALKFEKAEDETESAEARAWLDDLFDSRLIPAGFIPAPPDEEIGMNRRTVFYKDIEADGTAKRLIAGLNYEDDLTLLNLEFRFEEPEE